MTEDVQEAESFKYSNHVCLVLPLSSGRIAVFGCDRKLLAVVDAWEEAGKLVKEYEPPRPNQRKSKTRAPLDIDLDSIEI